MLTAPRRRGVRSRLCRTMCLYCATYMHFAATLAQAGDQTDMAAVSAAGLIAASGSAIIPSAPRIALIASALKTSTKFPTGLIPSAPSTSSIIPSEPPARFPTGLIPSAPKPSSTIPIEPPIPDEPSLAAPPTTIPEGAESSQIAVPPAHTGLIPSAPAPSIPQSTTLVTISSPFVTSSTRINGTLPVTVTNVVPTILPTGMTSTQEGLHPIPAPSTNPGDPDGHHEIPEPNFSITLPCRGCSPVVEITATGWETVPSFPINIPPAQEAETKASKPAAVTPAVTLTAGPSKVIVKPDPSGGSSFIIGDSTTVELGQTVTVGGKPIAVHTSNGQTNVVIGGTQTVPLQPPYNPPVATAVVGGSPLIVKPAPSGGNFIIGDSTVAPGKTITIANTPIAVQTDGPFPRVVLAGTQTIPLPPAAPQITDAPVLLPITLSNGATLTPLPPPPYDHNTPTPPGYLLASQTLLPGGPPVVIAGTTYSLDRSATALLVNGQPTTLPPAYGSLSTTVAAALLTLWDHVYTANRAGYYSLAPGTTLVPGGPAVTVSGSVISLEPHGTAAIIQGSTSAMEPVTAVVTVGRSGEGGVEGTGTGDGVPLSTVGRQSGGGVGRGESWIEGVLLIGVVLVGWLGVWL